MKIVEVWMSTDFLGGEEKYARRVAKARAVAERHLVPLDQVS